MGSQQGAVDYAQRESLVSGQSEILNMISNDEPLEYILSEIVKWVESHCHGDAYASILLMDDSGQRLMHGAAPSLPIEYNNAIHGVQIGPNVGSCGTSAYTGKTVIVEDIAQDPLWKDFRDLALGFGLRSCWSSPLVTKKGKVLGTFAIYHQYPNRPTPEDMQLIGLVSRTALLAIEYREVERERAKLAESEKAAYSRLKNERQRFYQMVMKAPAMIAILQGPDHIIELSNDRYNEVVGKGRSLQGLPVAQALPEIAEQGFVAILNRVYETGSPYYGNEVHVKLDRKNNGIYEDFYLNFAYLRLEDERGEVEGIFVHAVDITDQVLARKRAEESETRFRNFVLNAPTPIGIYVGREMRIQTVNDAILKAWDKKDASEVLGKTFREALPELEGQPFFQLLDDVYTSGIAYQAKEDKVFLMRNGKLATTYYNFTYSPLRNEKGEIFGVMNTATEVTDLVNARQKLAAAESELKNAIDIAELATWSMELTSKEIILSERLCVWLGVKGPGVPFQSMLELVQDEDRDRVAMQFAAALNGSDILEIEFSIVNALTRQTRILHFKGKVNVEDDAHVIIEGAAKDVTLQKNLSMELEQQVERRTLELKKLNLDLQHVNENLKQFAYVASHDLQEPLRKIKVYSDMLLTTQRQHLDANGQRYLDKVSKAAGRMSNLIKDLLEYARVENNKELVVHVSLNELMNRIKVDFEVLIEQKSAVVKIGSLPSVLAIPLQMNQLFFNLIGNALKFSKRDQPPVVEVWSRLLERNEISHHSGLDPQYEYCEVIIDDNGVGFDQHNSDKIFEIFQRLHSDSDFEGTGIGLALCKKIVNAHQGAIYVRSEEGIGSTFYVVLPVKRVGAEN